MALNRNRQIQLAVLNEMIRQTEQMHNITIAVTASVVCVALAGCILAYTGKAAGGSITTVGTITTAVLLPLNKTSAQSRDRKLSKILKEAKELD